MSFSLFLSRNADKAQRKLDKPLRVLIKEALEKLQNNPENLGENLSQPLTGIRSHHVTYQGKEFRIAYQIAAEREMVFILLIGPHENFYKKLKQLVYAG